MGVCRHCGSSSSSDTLFGACRSCANSPLCDRCGHPRGDHRHVFVRGGEGGCDRRVGDFQTLTSRPCECPGFQPVRGLLANAGFARLDPGPDPDEPLPSLRRA